MNKHLEFVILNCRYNKVEVIHLKRSQKSSKQTSSKMRLNSGISSIFQNIGWNVNYRVPSTQFQKLSKNFKIELPGNSTKSLISPVLWNSHLSETLEYGGDDEIAQKVIDRDNNTCQHMHSKRNWIRGKNDSNFEPSQRYRTKKKGASAKRHVIKISSQNQSESVKSSKRRTIEVCQIAETKHVINFSERN